ncbi:MAG: hypothetical protein DRJ31_10545, partial [Candidatus Methanomethylicota archaeon]
MSEKKDVLESILNGEQITEEIKTKRGVFVIALPLPKDIRNIEIEIARRLDGYPENQFSSDMLMKFRVYASLDTVIIKAPDWWNKLESAEDCPDDSLISFLYRRYLRFYQETQKKIEKSHFNGTAKIGKARIKTETVGDGAFQG